MKVTQLQCLLVLIMADSFCFFMYQPQHMMNLIVEKLFIVIA